MSKKWYENIPKKGMLCKVKSSDTVVVIVSSKQNPFNSVNFICKDKDGFYVTHDELTPLTSEEIWQFMPWQGMDSAPMNKPMLVTNNQDNVFSTVLFAEIERDCYKKWLPLPQVQS